MRTTTNGKYWPGVRVEIPDTVTDQTTRENIYRHQETLMSRFYSSRYNTPGPAQAEAERAIETSPYREYLIPFAVPVRD